MMHFGLSMPEDAVIEVVGPGGQSDAPAAWYKELSSFVKGLNWHQSVLDPCLFTLRVPENSSETLSLNSRVVSRAANGG